MSEKQSLNIKSEKKRKPQWLRNTIGVGIFAASAALGIYIGADRSSFEEDATAIETAEEAANFAIPTALGVMIGGSIAIAMLGGVDNGPDKLPYKNDGATVPKPDAEQETAEITLSEVAQAVNDGTMRREIDQAVGNDPDLTF